METKKQQAINFIKAGHTKKALKLMKNFRREFSKDQLRDFQIAFECWTDEKRRKFYTSLGIDVDLSISSSLLLTREYAK